MTWRQLPYFRYFPRSYILSSGRTQLGLLGCALRVEQVCPDVGYVHADVPGLAHKIRTTPLSPEQLMLLLTLLTEKSSALTCGFGGSTRCDENPCCKSVHLLNRPAGSFFPTLVSPTSFHDRGRRALGDPGCFGPGKWSLARVLPPKAQTSSDSARGRPWRN